MLRFRPLFSDGPIVEGPSVEGVFLIEAEPFIDDRGRLERLTCAREFAAAGLDPRVAQSSLIDNPRRGTLRGMHYQRAPAAAKAVRCLRGRIHDVVVDIRDDSPTRGRSVAVELSEGDGRLLYVPAGLAHGFLTLTDHALVYYHTTAPHSDAHGAGFRWNDPAFGLRWPEEPRVIASRDASYPDFIPGW